jgi:hypothetical protein
MLLAAGLMICASLPAVAQIKGSGPTISTKNMPGYCLNMAVDMFALKPNKVKVKKAAEGNGIFTVAGAADHGENGKKDFHCTFDTEGKFVEMVVEATGGE